MFHYGRVENRYGSRSTDGDRMRYSWSVRNVERLLKRVEVLFFSRFQILEERLQGRSMFRESVLHPVRSLARHYAVDDAVAFEILQGVRKRLVREALISVFSILNDTSRGGVGIGPMMDRHFRPSKMAVAVISYHCSSMQLSTSLFTF